MSRLPSTADRVEALPQLPSLSIAESRDFYCSFLGFGEVVYEDDSFLILRRQFAGAPIELHFWLTDNRAFCEHSSVYLRGGGIDVLHADFAARNVPDMSALAVRPWNMEEFHVRDPHGNLLKFGRIPLAQD